MLMSMDTKELRKTIETELATLQENDNPKETETSPYGLNFYKVLGLSSKELIHSRFIAFLLNPKSDHGCGDFFLNKFIELLNKKDANLGADNQWESIKREKGSRNGRVDIFIKNKTSERHIVIENKIYAIDQPRQMKRYRDANREAILVYLTLDGRKASSRSIGKDKIDYIRLSYKDDIVSWINSCSEVKPNCKVSFLLTEYRELVKQLTKKIVEDEKILPILTQDKETLEIFLEIYNDVCKKTPVDDVDKFILSRINHLKAYMIKNKFCGENNSLLQKLCDKEGNGWEWELNGVKWVTQKGWGFNIQKKGADKSKNRIEFKFNKKTFENCIYSVYKEGVKESGRLSKEYFNWYMKNVFFELAGENMENTGLFKELEKTIKKHMI